MKPLVRSLSIIAWIVASSLMCRAQDEPSLNLDTPWKFLPGDDLAYASPTFDDSNWKPLRVDKIWEEQGFDPMDRFAWYRLKFVIPSSMRAQSFLKDSLLFFLGKINNFDQTFLNGTLIGINGKAVAADTPADTAFLKAPMEHWNLERRYILSASDPRIRWDRENVIAVRVFDQGGQGGMWSGKQELRAVRLQDYLSLDISAKPFAFQGLDVHKTVTAKNTSAALALDGRFSIRASNKVTGQTVTQTAQAVSLSPLNAQNFTIHVPGQDQSCVVEYSFEFSQTKQSAVFREETPYLLTPPVPARPRINGARITGARPRRPFLHAVAATGEKPLRYEAKGLPQGLSIDNNSGIITGSAADSGRHEVSLTVSNSQGTATANLTIVIGDELALTPPMGWNSWNCWGLTVDAGKVADAAKAFVHTGLKDHGWTYINVDDGWEIKGDSPAPKRDPEGKILTNEKFPDMKALGDSIHSLGLKFGIYSSPGPLTCGGYTASYGHELTDARAFAEWGIDYLKYDWCSYDGIAKDKSRAELMKPYHVMREALDAIGRDIVYSLCQYGMGNVWEWGAEVGGDLWRTTGDITDTWKSMSDIGFGQVANAPYAGPGRWNDPDMLVVGWVGWGPNLHPTALTPDEQYTHISLWCLLSAPLLIGCDLTRLDPFTLNLLTNDEVLALDQDPLGKQATPIMTEGSLQVWVKELSDGTKAVGLFNLGEKAENFTVPFSRIGLEGKQQLRDVWRQKDLGTVSDAVKASVPPHGVVLLKTVKS